MGVRLKRAFVFPGQGSQVVGMGRDLVEAFGAAREVFEEVDDALGEHLSRLIFEGPEDELVLTRNAQPALMATSLAVVRTIEMVGGRGLADLAAYVAGHSLGEYSALAAARALTISDAARLLRRRGEAMQKAVPVGEGAMAALLGADLETAQEIAEQAAQGEVCTVANDNAPGQVVLSGATAAVERAIEVAKEQGIKRAIMLPVSAPFHCALMAPAADVMAQALGAVDLRAPAVPVVANVSAAAVDDPSEIRALLVEQVASMVRWRESVAHMREAGVEMQVECGAGKVLTGLAKRIDRDLEAVAAGTVSEVDAFMNAL